MQSPQTASGRAQTSLSFFLKGLPACSATLLALVLVECAVGAAFLTAHMVQLRATCEPEEWQAMATTLSAQLSFATLTLQALWADNGFQLVASTVWGCITGLLWILVLAVTGHNLAPGAQAGGSIAAVVLTALNAWLACLSYQQLGWRQHSWLSCDPQRSHAAEQQHLSAARNRFWTCARCCMHALVLHAVSGLVLALTARPAATTASPAAGQLVSRAAADTGVLVSVGLTLLLMLWVLLTRWAVRAKAQKVVVLATATIAGAMLPPAVQLFFVFDPATPWPQPIVVRVLLLALPMATWMALLALTCHAFRAVMKLLRQPWVTEPALDSGAPRSGPVEPEVPDALKPLVQGAWLLKTNPQPSTCSLSGSSKQSLSTTVSMVPVASSSAVSSTSPGAHLAPSCLRALLQAWRTRQHMRFFQLSFDLSTLRWSWNKYVLLCFVDSISCNEERLSLTLHCVLDPDLELAFADRDTWTQWLTGLQLLTGTTAVATGSATAVPGQHSVADTVSMELHPAFTLQRDMVKAALSCNPAKAPASRLLATSRRQSVLDPAAQGLREAQDMAQRMLQEVLPAVASMWPIGLQQPEVAAAAPMPAPNQQFQAARNLTIGAWQRQQQVQSVAAAPSLCTGSTQWQSIEQGAGAANSAAAATMFGSFRVPTGLLSSPVAQARRAAGYSSSSGQEVAAGPDSSKSDAAAGAAKSAFNFLHTGGGSGGSVDGSSRQHTPTLVHSTLNAGYAPWAARPPSPLGNEARSERLRHADAAAAHGHLSPDKRQQLMLWLQQQSSGSCPESDGPLSSPVYSCSLDSGQLKPAHVLPLLQEHSSGCHNSAVCGTFDMQPLPAPAATAALQARAGSRLSGSMQAQWGGSMAAHCVVPTGWQQYSSVHSPKAHSVHSRSSLGRSCSLPSLRASPELGEDGSGEIELQLRGGLQPAACQAAAPTSSPAAPPAFEPNSCAQPVAPLLNAPAATAPAALPAADACCDGLIDDAVLAAVAAAEEEQKRMVAAAPEQQQQQQAVVPAVPADAAAASDAAAVAAVDLGQQVALPAAESSSIASFEIQPLGAIQEHPAALRSTMFSFGGQSRRARDRTISMTGIVNAAHTLPAATAASTSPDLAPAAAAAAAATGGAQDSSSTATAGSPFARPGLLDRIASFKAFVAGSTPTQQPSSDTAAASAAATAAATAATATVPEGADSRSLRRTSGSLTAARVGSAGSGSRLLRRGTASFSSRPSFGAARSISAAWQGSFAARSTWSDWDDPFSLNGTLDNSLEGLNVEASAAAAAAAAATTAEPGTTDSAPQLQQPQPQPQLLPLRRQRPGALEPVLSVTHEEQQELEQQQHTPAATKCTPALGDSMQPQAAAVEACVTEQQQQQQQGPADEPCMDLQAAYALAMQGMRPGPKKLQLPAAQPSTEQAALKQQGSSNSQQPPTSWRIPAAPAAAEDPHGAAGISSHTQQQQQQGQQQLAAAPAHASIGQLQQHEVVARSGSPNPSDASLSSFNSNRTAFTGAGSIASFWWVDGGRAGLPTLTSEELAQINRPASPHLNRPGSPLLHWGQAQPQQRAPSPLQPSLQTAPVMSPLACTPGAASQAGSCAQGNAAADTLFAMCHPRVVATPLDLFDFSSSTIRWRPRVRTSGHSHGRTSGRSHGRTSGRSRARSSGRSRERSSGRSRSRSCACRGYIITPPRPAMRLCHVSSPSSDAAVSPQQQQQQQQHQQQQPQAGGVAATQSWMSPNGVLAPQVPVAVIPWSSIPIVRRLGQGSEGTVLEGRYMDSPVAIKEGPSSSEVAMFLAAGSHDNLVGLRGLTQKPDGTRCLVLELCVRGSLDDLIHRSGNSPLDRPPIPFEFPAAAAGHSSSPAPAAAAAAGSSLAAPIGSSSFAAPSRPAAAGPAGSNGSSISVGPAGSASSISVGPYGSISSISSRWQHVTRPDLIRLMPLLRNFLRGLLHLHTHSPAILHRDIKPANLLVSHGMQVKIGDLGMARFVLPPPPPSPKTSSPGPNTACPSGTNGSSTAPKPAAASAARGSSTPPAALSPRPSGGDTGPARHSCCSSTPGTPKALATRTFTPGIVGTITYTAPEVLGVMDEHEQAGASSVETVLKADVYSVGVTLWECVQRQRPWAGVDSMQLWTMWVTDPHSVRLPPLSVHPLAGEAERAVLAALQQLVDDCTALHPQQRPSTLQVLERVRQLHQQTERIRMAMAGQLLPLPSESVATVSEEASVA